MSDQNSSDINSRRSFQYILIFALLALLPTTQNALMGWMYIIVPTAVFFYLYKWEQGLKYVIAGTIIAGIASVFISPIGSTIFTLTLVPLGYTLVQSAFREDSPASSALKGTCFPLFCWIAIIAVHIAMTGVNPVTEFLRGLDQAVDQALVFYQQNDSLAPETLAIIEQSLIQMKTALPVILPVITPALLFSMALFITWATMMVSNRLVRRFTGYRPWIEHREWHVPNRLILVYLTTVFMAIIPSAIIRFIGINLVISLSMVYVLQGFAVFSFYLHRWRVPTLLRFFLYAMMLFQTFGMMLLLFAGIGDAWMDLRRLKNDKDESDTNSNT